ncbi:MAG: copper resistance D family protein [Acidobacteriota bacterium]
MQGLADFVDDLLIALELIAFALAVGGVVWGLAMRRPWRRPAGPLTTEGSSLGLMFGGASGLLVCQLAHFLVKAWILGVTLGRSPFPAFFHTPLFQAGLYRALLASAMIGCIAWLRQRPSSMRRWLAVTVVALLLLINSAWLLHAVSRLDDRIQLMTLTTAHELGGAAWAGGLAQLLLFWRRRARHPALDRLWPEALRRFSVVASASIALIVATGTALSLSYVGSWRGLFGTAYGAVLLAKIALLGTALGFGAYNHRIVRRVSREEQPEGLRRQVPYFVEVEAFIMVAILLAAAALASQPPAVDTPRQTASWSEVRGIFTPRLPRLTSPPHVTLNVEDDPSTWSTPEKLRSTHWSEFNHNVSGLFLLAMGLLALMEHTRLRWLARHWPLGFLGLGLFLIIRSDPSTWPLGPHTFWESLGDAEVLQHRLATLLVFALGFMEWRAHSPRAAGTRLPYVFPLLSLVGGGLLLTHNHIGFQLKSKFLIQISHTAMGMLAVLLGSGRWLELRVGEKAGKLAGVGSKMALILIGVILTFYNETIE